MKTFTLKLSDDQFETLWDSLSESLDMMDFDDSDESKEERENRLKEMKVLLEVKEQLAAQLSR